VSLLRLPEVLEDPLLVLKLFNLALLEVVQQLFLSFAQLILLLSLYGLRCHKLLILIVF